MSDYPTIGSEIADIIAKGSKALTSAQRTCLIGAVVVYLEEVSRRPHPAPQVVRVPDAAYSLPSAPGWYVELSDGKPFYMTEQQAVAFNTCRNDVIQSNQAARTPRLFGWWREDDFRRVSDTDEYRASDMLADGYKPLCLMGADWPLVNPQAGAVVGDVERDVETAVAQAVEFAEYVVGHAKGEMVKAAERFLSLPYSQELKARLATKDTP